MGRRGRGRKGRVREAERKGEKERFGEEMRGKGRGRKGRGREGREGSVPLQFLRRVAASDFTHAIRGLQEALLLQRPRDA